MINSVSSVVHFLKFSSVQLDPRPPTHYILDVVASVTDVWKAQTRICQQRDRDRDGRGSSEDTACLHPLVPSSRLRISEHSAPFSGFY